VANNKNKSRVIVGNSEWDEAEVKVCQARQARANIIGWALALGVVLAMFIAVYAMINHDRELLGQVWEMARNLLFMTTGWAIGTVTHNMSK
jgi:hypothetical protein